MLNVYLGNFHPDLEDALCQHILEIRKKAPLSEIAIIVPSEHVRKRIKILLTAECGMSLLGVHFLTFHTLSLKLCEEAYGRIRHMISDDFFFSELIRHILRTGAADVDMFRQFAETPEGCSAIWRTIRELREAGVEPDNVIEAVREGYFDQEDYGKIIAMSAMYREFLLRKREKGITDYSDLPEMASGNIPSSAYLRRFGEIIYYGFYDLTQVQFDMMRLIVKHLPSAIFFPYTEGLPAMSFAGRFYDSYIQGLLSDNSKVIKVSDSATLGGDSKTLFPVKSSVAIINTSGMEDEITAIAKTILRLVEAEGCSFSEIGVVARDINEYIHIIKRIFDAHKIPFASTGTEPACRYPFVKTVQILISVHENNYRRSDIIELVSSHWCNKILKDFCPEGIELRPDKWDVVTCRAGISKGKDEWSRLERYLEDGLVISNANNEDEPEAKASGADIAVLYSFVRSLIDDFSSLPTVCSWSGYVELFDTLVRKYIDVDGLDKEHPEIDEALLSLKSFDLISPEVNLSEFISTLSRSLEGRRFKVCDTDIAGVQVLDAMSGRAIPFRILFVAGMNEKVFPRNIREDPLLRDSARRVMERVLGYKVPEKLSGFEEEKLIFYLLLQSAGERLYILYQRTDDSGETRIPSWYIPEIKTSYPLKELRVPRRLSDKYALSELYDYRFLPYHDLSARLIIEGTDPKPVMLKNDLNYNLYANGLKAIIQRDKMQTGLMKYDGITGYIESYWNGLLERGISPTSLELYAQCPFSYFARHLLRSVKIERPETIFEVHPVDKGKICHRILKGFYSRYVKAKEIDIKACLEDEAAAVFSQFEQDNPVGYPAIWEVEKERLLSLLQDLIERDLDDLAQTGFFPYVFEAEAEGSLSIFLPGFLINDLPFHGFLDRVDINKSSGCYRIIDYKIKMGARAKPEDRDLDLAAIRGRRLQPPVYILLANNYLGGKRGMENLLCRDVRFYYLAPNWLNEKDEHRFTDFPGDCWYTGLGERIRGTIGLLLEGIKDGFFFILPGNYCDNCDYSSICRKNHFPTRLRAKKDDKIAKGYRELRKKEMES